MTEIQNLVVNPAFVVILLQVIDFSLHPCALVIEHCGNFSFEMLVVLLLLPFSQLVSSSP
jgi:hypothetical protein